MADVSVGFRVDDENPGHVRVSIFAGTNFGARGHAGVLTFRAEEWPVIKMCLLVSGFDHIPFYGAPGPALQDERADE